MPICPSDVFLQLEPEQMAAMAAKAEKEIEGTVEGARKSEEQQGTFDKDKARSSHEQYAKGTEKKRWD